MSLRRGAAAIYLLAILVMCVRAGEPEHLWWWLIMIPLAAWIVSPVLGGLYCFRHIKHDGARKFFAALLAIVAMFGIALKWHTMLIGPSDAQNALIFVFVPLYQWLAVLFSLALTWLFKKALESIGRHSGR